MTVELDEYDDVNADVAERLVKLTDEVIGLWTDDYSMAAVPIADDEWVVYVESKPHNVDFRTGARVADEDIREIFLSHHERARPCNFKNYIWRDGPILHPDAKEEAVRTVVELMQDLQHDSRHKPLFDW